MGIDVRIETEGGACISELGDPQNRMNRLLSIPGLDSTHCLQFIDLYGDTVFNRLQIPALQSELSSLRSLITESNVLELKRVYLERASAWPKVAFEEAQKEMRLLSLSELENHLQAVMALVSDALDRGPHHYVRFVGD